MTIEEVSRETGWTVLFIREWIAQNKDHPFGVMVRFPGSKRRTFRINEEAFYRWLNGDRGQGATSSIQR